MICCFTGRKGELIRLRCGGSGSEISRKERRWRKMMGKGHASVAMAFLLVKFALFVLPHNNKSGNTKTRLGIRRHADRSDGVLYAASVCLSFSLYML